MFVHVGPFRYGVRLVHGHIEHEGEPCFGLCDNIRQEILISDVPPERQRLQVFFHELMHAWWYHFDVDSGDQEAVVDLVGIAMTDFVTQALRKLDRAELRRALAPTADSAEERSAISPRTARPTATAVADDGVAERSRRSAAAGEADVHHCATIEQAGWRMRVYEANAPDASRKAG